MHLDGSRPARDGVTERLYGFIRQHSFRQLATEVVLEGLLEVVWKSIEARLQPADPSFGVIVEYLTLGAVLYPGETSYPIRGFLRVIRETLDFFTAGFFAEPI